MSIPFYEKRGLLPQVRLIPQMRPSSQWKNTEISFYDFLSYVISKGWIDSSKLGAESAYSDSSQVMSQILSFCEENLSADSGFRKLVYKKLIHNEQLSGNLVCLALIDQGILDATMRPMKNFKMEMRRLHLPLFVRNWKY